MRFLFCLGVYLKKIALFALLFLKTVLGTLYWYFEPTWLNTDVDTAIQEIREFMDMFVH